MCMLVNFLYLHVLFLCVYVFFHLTLIVIPTYMCVGSHFLRMWLYSMLLSGGRENSIWKEGLWIPHFFIFFLIFEKCIGMLRNFSIVTMQHVPVWKCRVFFTCIAIEIVQGVRVSKHLMFFASVGKWHICFVSCFGKKIGYQ